MIVIEGLTKQQKALAQTLWDMDTMDEVENYMNGLPKRMREQAQTVYELLIAAHFDQIMDTDLAEKVINSVK